MILFLIFGTVYALVKLIYAAIEYLKWTGTKL